MSRFVLIVDDDEALAENVAEIVASLGVEVMVAGILPKVEELIARVRDRRSS